MDLATQQRNVAAEDRSSLVERIQSGDERAESELTQLYNQRIFVMALARTRDREVARDLTQDVLIAVLQALRNGQMREPGRLTGFIYGTARNLVNNYFRSCTQQPNFESLSEDLPVAGTDNPETAARRDMVRGLLARVHTVDRKILLMMLVEGYKAEEVAFQLHLSSEVVRQRKSRALKKIVERVKRMSRK
jgi:RNA polymerase sigma-70 factor (ECF subfamily)